MGEGVVGGLACVVCVVVGVGLVSLFRLICWQSKGDHKYKCNMPTVSHLCVLSNSEGFVKDLQKSG